MPPFVLVYSRGKSKAEPRLSALGIEYSRTETPLRDILLQVDPVCLILEGAEEHLVEFCRFCLQSSISFVAQDPETEEDILDALAHMEEEFEPWVLAKVRAPVFDVARTVEFLKISVFDLVSPKRLEELRSDQQLASLTFNIWDYSPNDMVVQAAIMFEHSCTRLGLNIDFDRIVYFCVVLRACYGFRRYHCFRHAVDVAQAVYCFDLQGWGYHGADERLSGLDAAALIIAGLGHDLLHPSVTTRTVVQASTDFANKFGCLEEFHYSVFMSLLRPLMPEVLVPKMAEKLQMLTAATEMRKHQHYLDLPLDDTPEGRDNYLCILIKGADLCNCSRVFDSSIRQSVALGFEIINEFVVREHLNLSPLTNTATKPTCSASCSMGSTQEAWLRIQADNSNFVSTFYEPMLAKVSKKAEGNNRHMIAALKKQFIETRARYDAESPPEFFDQLFI